MLRVTVFRRSVSNSAFKDSQAKINEFLTYHSTPASLKPWIYRPKNANTLLSMDLKDPTTNAPLQPRQPVKPLNRKVLNDYIWTAPSSAELLNLLTQWTSITTRKRAVWDYFSPQHVQNILIATFFRLGQYSSFVQLLYSQRKKFITAENADIYNIEQFFNTIVMCQLQRSVVVQYKDIPTAGKKLVNAWERVIHKENKTGLANLLVNAFQRQQGTNVQIDLPKIDVNLPTIDIGSKNNGKLASFITEHKNIYLIARTILDFGESDEAVTKFVQEYQNITSKLGRPDIYDQYVSNLKQLLEKKKDEPVETQVEDN